MPLERCDCMRSPKETCSSDQLTTSLDTVSITCGKAPPPFLQSFIGKRKGQKELTYFATVFLISSSLILGKKSLTPLIKSAFGVLFRYCCFFSFEIGGRIRSAAALFFVMNGCWRIPARVIRFTGEYSRSFWSKSLASRTVSWILITCTHSGPHKTKTTSLGIQLNLPTSISNRKFVASALNWRNSLLHALWFQN